MKLADLTWTEVKDQTPAVALLPTGSCEQHGPHCPLSTDSLIAEALANYSASQTESLLLPPISVGVSREHSKFPGTLSVSPETFRAYLYDISLSAKENGVKSLIVVNGHGGNIPSIREVCQKLYHEQNFLALEWTWFKVIEAEEMGHAGKLETSLVMYLKESPLRGSPKKGTDRWGHDLYGARFTYDVSEFSESGIVGDPAEASQQRGEELFNKSFEKLKKLICELSNGGPDFLEEREI